MPNNVFKIVAIISVGLIVFSVATMLAMVWLIANYDIPGEVMAIMVAPISSAVAGVAGIVGIVFSVQQAQGQVPQIPQLPQEPQERA